MYPFKQIEICIVCLSQDSYKISDAAIIISHPVYRFIELWVVILLKISRLSRDHDLHGERKFSEYYRRDDKILNGSACSNILV
jgi:hypothetical protein